MIKPPKVECSGFAHEYRHSYWLKFVDLLDMISSGEFEEMLKDLPRTQLQKVIDAVERRRKSAGVGECSLLEPRSGGVKGN